MCLSALSCLRAARHMRYSSPLLPPGAPASAKAAAACLVFMLAICIRRPTCSKNKLHVVQGVVDYMYM